MAVLRASMVVTYYIKLFRTGADRCNGILMSLLLLGAETKNMESPRQTLASNTMYFNNFIQLNKVILLFIITVNVLLPIRNVLSKQIHIQSEQ